MGGACIGALAFRNNTLRAAKEKLARSESVLHFQSQILTDKTELFLVPRRKQFTAAVFGCHYRSNAHISERRARM
jgi:hypothetical protein